MEKNNRQINMELCFEECKGILKALAYKYKGIYNGDIEEAFANACMWLVELYDNFDRNRATFVTYAYSSVENKFINEGKKIYRENQYISHSSIEDLDRDGYLISDCNEDDLIDDRMTIGQRERYDLYLKLYECVDILSERERTIFKLFYYNNWNIKDIADVLELSEIRIKEIKSKIVKKMLKNYENM